MDGFRSGYEAVAWAIRRTKTPIIDGPSLGALSRKSGSHDVLPTLDKWEKLAEASLILLNVERSCTRLEHAAVWTYFTGCTVVASAMLIQHIANESGRDRWFVRDVVLSWARDRPQHTLVWWARKYSVDKSTVTRWSQSIGRRLDNHFRNGLAKVEDRLFETGHCS